MAQTLTFLAFETTRDAVIAALPRILSVYEDAARRPVAIYEVAKPLSIVTLDGWFADKWRQQSFARNEALDIASTLCAALACKAYVVNLFSGSCSIARAVIFDADGDRIHDEEPLFSEETPAPYDVDHLFFAPIARVEREIGLRITDGLALAAGIGEPQSVLLPAHAGDLAENFDVGIPAHLLPFMIRSGGVQPKPPLNDDDEIDDEMRARIRSIEAKALAKLRAAFPR